MRTTPLRVGGLSPIDACLWAEGPLERMRGLLGRDGLPRGTAMAFPHCRAVHTVGMRFALDVAFLDREGRLLRVARGVRPGRLLVWGGWRARTVIEAESGWLVPRDAQSTEYR